MSYRPSFGRCGSWACACWLCASLLGIVDCGDAASGQEYVIGKPLDAGSDVKTGPCTSSELKCSNKCVNPNTDATNCGGCGVKCAAGQLCQAGNCGLECTGGTMTCGNSCIDPKNDPANCGGCGKTCQQGEVCSAGACALQCAGGTTKCGNKCVDPSNDPANCGSCGKQCTGAEVCSGGNCTLQCGGTSTKCGSKCVDTSSDPANCGSCSNACPGVSNGAAGCLAGKCVVASCNPPFKDCNTDVADGCEAKTTIDPNNCNGCGIVCPPPVNAIASCAESKCGLGECNEGFGNCDSVAANGCESPTSTDPTNCGGCGKICSNANLTPACSAGVCSGACNAGFGDCNNNKQLDGCETDLSKDANNCGACGTSCGAGTCGTTVSASMTTNPPDWMFNGDATYESGTSSGVLTEAAQSKKGTIIYKNSILTDSFTATFDFQISGGSGGGDGMAFMIQTTGNTAVGAGAAGLATTGLNGFGVEFDPFQNTAACALPDPASEHIAVNDLASCSSGQPTHLQINSSLSFGLRDTGWHTCVIQLSNGALSVSVDSNPVLSNINLPGFAPGTKYFYGFGAATGGASERHQIRQVSLTFPSARCL